MPPFLWRLRIFELKSEIKSEILINMVDAISLKGQVLKDYLLTIIQKIDDQTTVEDVFDQIALLEDVYIAEQQISNGEEISQETLEDRSGGWNKSK